MFLIIANTSSTNVFILVKTLPKVVFIKVLFPTLCLTIKRNEIVELWKNLFENKQLKLNILEKDENKYWISQRKHACQTKEVFQLERGHLKKHQNYRQNLFHGTANKKLFCIFVFMTFFMT